LVKTTTGKSGETATESLYTYDETTGRLLSITNYAEESSRIDFHYDADSRKTKVQKFSSEMEILERYKQSMLFDSLLTPAERGVGVPIGGSVITIYDERDQEVEQQIVDAEGQLVNRFVRTYNANGQIIELKPIWVNPAALFFDKALGQLNPEHFKHLHRQMTTLVSDEVPAGTQYTYDSQNRVTNIRERDSGFERIMTITYNDRGEKAEERMDFTDRRNEYGLLVPGTTPHLPDHSLVIRYAYEYDSYGNWTQQVVSCPSRPDSVSNRKLTYH